MNRQVKDCAWIPEFNIMLNERAAEEYLWGINDCGIFTSRIMRMSGREIVTPTWHDEKSANELLTKKSLLHIALEVFGDPIPWGSCIIGDIFIAETCRPEPLYKYTLGAFDGKQYLSPRPDRGFMNMPASMLLLGWRT